MKNLLILFTTLLLSTSALVAQTVPEGMRFQAIARSLNGSLLKKEALAVRVELLTNGVKEEIYYSELHEVRSSDMGLLDFVIGEGQANMGSFTDIPWEKTEMWVRISIKTSADRNYQIISSGQLHAVPYAIYAAKTSEINGNNHQRVPGLGMNSINWTLEGNHDSPARNNGNPVLGTTDANDLVIVTNNIPRIIIDKDGAIHFLVDVDFNGATNVDGTTTLNGSLDVTNMAATHLSGTLTVDQATLLNHALLVQNMAATHMTGTLDVDKTLNVDGATTLNSTLDVTGMSATHLSGTLTVDKTTTLNDDLTVANAAPTHLTGDLTVDGAVNSGTVTVDASLEVTGMHPAHLTGTLEVDKLATLEEGLHVSGTGEVGPNGDYLAFFDNREGGASDGIAIKLGTSQVSKETNYMTFYKGTGNGTAGRIEGYDVGDMADIPVPTEEEIWTAVCIGIADFNPVTIIWTQMATALNLFGDAWNATTIPAFDIPDIPAFTIADVPALTIPDVPAFVIPDVPGFVIPDIPGVVLPDIPGLTIGPLLCAEVCFCPCEDLSWDCCCAEVCLIPGSFTVWPSITIPDFPGIAIPDFPGIPIPDFPGIVVPDFPGVVIPDFPGLVIPAVPELDFSEIFGEIPHIPTFSDFLVAEGICPNADIFGIPNGYLGRLAAWAFEHRLQNLVGLDPVKLLGNALAWGLTTAVLNDGVVYGSKGADYAEYLPKMYPTEQFLKGEVVGIHNGLVSRSTVNADQILAITSQPLVLGNMPESGETASHEKIAFLGQIPVFVMGPVNKGDYIIPSGKNDGTAKAMPASSITANMLSQVLGTAWSAYDGEGVTLINTSIGLRPMEIAEVLKKQGEAEGNMQQQVTVQRSNSEMMSRDLEQMKNALGISPVKYNP